MHIWDVQQSWQKLARSHFMVGKEWRPPLAKATCFKLAPQQPQPKSPETKTRHKNKLQLWLKILHISVTQQSIQKRKEVRWLPLPIPWRWMDGLCVLSPPRPRNVTLEGLITDLRNIKTNLRTSTTLAKDIADLRCATQSFISAQLKCTTACGSHVVCYAAVGISRGISYYLRYRSGHTHQLPNPSSTTF